MFNIIKSFTFCYVKIGYFVTNVKTSLVNNTTNTIRNTKFSQYRFLKEHEHIYGDFQLHYCAFKGYKGKRLDVIKNLEVSF